MKRFLISNIKFGGFAILAILSLILTSKTITSKFFNLEIDKEKNILLLGNSHMQNSINDKELPHVLNLGRGGSTYFYEYIKLKGIIENNSQIDTLLLGYTYQDLTPEMDSWLIGKDKLKFKMRNHFHLFSWDNYFNLLKTNPIEVLATTPQTIYYNFIALKAGLSSLGGYQKLERFKLTEALDKFKSTPQPLASDGFSKYQLVYLSRIYEFCIENEIKLILLSTPVRKEEIALFSDYQTFYKNHVKENFPSATLIDHSKFRLPDNHYADLDHINYLGAKVYTAYLKSNIFK